ncbi:hypothetical protein [Agrobacterium pusense]|uniref:hypothetical protein n=1 Tax=Agrobacterium pusense TaxID=648995 RepID=UPI000512FC30|nr:hypothetical protein [Agrobacterium pusense]ANV24381.1 hypothetical protein BA939_10840 [Rhizobium sp. S41]KGE84010.1 hypothetical protein LW14_02205 [Rhizobium sp. H41]QWW74036.1 hypothetical protein KP800_00545 [Agrobacterium pusense]
MTVSDTKFLSLLFAEGRVLDNLKFFPGPDCVSADQLFEAGEAAIKAALAADSGDDIPGDGRESISIGEYVQSL